jgi:hypothetical protein
MHRLLYFIIFIILILSLFIYSYSTEGFMNNMYSNYSTSNYPAITTDYLVQDTFPKITSSNGISKNNANNIWWHYPTFPLGSYKQITNNIRYSNNPDVGRCTPASMCGAMYHKRQQPNTNYTTPLPPVPLTAGNRIGYFATNTNLLPFQTNMVNILY